ncbi:unnamed protein product [Calypogeia fissa]
MTLLPALMRRRLRTRGLAGAGRECEGLLKSWRVMGTEERWKLPMRLTGERARGPERVEVVRVEDVVHREGDEASEWLSDGWIGSSMVYDKFEWGIEVSDRGFGVVSWSRKGRAVGVGGVDGAVDRDSIVVASLSTPFEVVVLSNW